MDHNRLTGELGESQSFDVLGVIDHHNEEDAVSQETGPEPRIIEKAGSCTSLVVRYSKPAWESLSYDSLSSGAAHGQDESLVSDSTVTQGWDAQIAKMALSSVLIDTANLTAPGKVEDVDTEAVNYLEAKIYLSTKEAKSWNRDEYYKEIDDAKKDLDALTLDEILSKDYKQWTENGENVGISSVVKPLRYLSKKANDDPNTFAERLWFFMGGQSLSVFAIMTTSTSPEGNFQKELLVQAKRCHFATLSDFIERAVPALQLEDTRVDHITTSDAIPKTAAFWRKIWVQKDVSQSRKQVAPLLRECVRTNAS